VTIKFPGAEAVQESTAVPDLMILCGDRLQLRPVEGDMVDDRLTTPLNPLSGVIVMLELPVSVTLRFRLGGLALIWKSWTTYLTVADCDNAPLVPVTVTV
jgi:hypothetical protein